MASTHPELTPSFVANALGTGATGSVNAETPYTSVVSDSRKVSPGCLFVALAGENFDGHQFIPQAVAKGARGIVCSKDYQDAGSSLSSFFRVTDTLAAYRALAAEWRKGFRIPVVMVAGSNGKTTTKELLSAILSGKFTNVHKTQGSENGFVGIPMTLLELKPSHDAAVIEVGIDEPGAMIRHVAIVKPTGAVLTAIGPEHLEKLKDIETVAHEEGLGLSATAEQGGFVAINLNDPSIRPHREKIASARKLCYALEGTPEAKHADLSGAISADGSKLMLRGRAQGELTLPLAGRHNAINLLSAVAVALELELSVEEIRRGLARFAGAPGRSEVREVGKGSFKIQALCDYYNAQPLSVAAGLDLLADLGRAAPQAELWACLGDMLELGTNEENYHRELADRIVAHKIQNVLLFGPRMKWLQDELAKRKAQGKFTGRCAHFDTHAALASDALHGLKSGDRILIKGSRGMRMEEAWKVIEADARFKS